MGKCSRHGPKVALILILLFCFGLQVWDGLVKYFGRQTTLVSTTEQLKSARLPTISFCPGMKGGKLFYDFVEELKGTFNSTEQMNGSLIEANAVASWNENTYDFNDVIPFLKSPALNWDAAPEIRIAQVGYNEDLKATMRELHTIYGRCYSVIFGEDLKSSSEYYTITFNMTHIEKLLIFAGEEYNDVGLFGGFFPITPTVISLRRDEANTMMTQFDHFEPLHQDDSGSGGVPCDDGEDYSYPKCVSDWSFREYIEVFRRRNKTVCWYMGGQSLVADVTKTPMCKTAEEDDFARNQGYFEVIELLDNPRKTGCPKNCIQSVLRVEEAFEPHQVYKGNISYVYVASTMKSRHEEEVLMYDFNTIVAATGGSLGLFLGISCYSVLTYLGKKGSKRMNCDVDCQ